MFLRVFLSVFFDPGKVVKLDTEISESEYLRVKAFLDHKLKADGSYEYLVKWDEENTIADSWEPKENFPDPSILADYWKKHKNKQSKNVPKQNEVTKRGPGRPPKNQNKNNKTTKTKNKTVKPKSIANLNLVSIFLLLIFFPLTLGNLSINGTFYFCDEVGDNNATTPFIDVHRPYNNHEENELNNEHTHVHTPEVISQHIHADIPHHDNIQHEIALDNIDTHTPGLSSPCINNSDSSITINLSGSKAHNEINSYIDIVSDKEANSIYYAASVESNSNGKDDISKNEAVTEKFVIQY
jgi:hypothetical protein